jgi:hypothetical protein
MDPYIYLYTFDILDDPETAEIDSDDDSNGGWDAKIEFVCEESGIYYVIVRHYNSDSGMTGTYKIVVELLEG